MRVLIMNAIRLHLLVPISSTSFHYPTPRHSHHLQQAQMHHRLPSRRPLGNQVGFSPVTHLAMADW